MKNIKRFLLASFFHFLIFSISLLFLYVVYILFYPIEGWIWFGLLKQEFARLYGIISGFVSLISFFVLVGILERNYYTKIYKSKYHSIHLLDYSALLFLFLLFVYFRYSILEGFSIVNDLWR